MKLIGEAVKSVSQSIHPSFPKIARIGNIQKIQGQGLTQPKGKEKQIAYILYTHTHPIGNAPVLVVMKGMIC